MCASRVANLPPTWNATRAFSQPAADGAIASSCDREDMLNSGWEWLDGVNLQQVFDKRFRVMQGCPHHVRGRFRQATRCALEARHNAIRAQDRISEIRAWKLFCLLPFVLLHRPIGGSRVSREDLLERFDKFAQGKWCDLFEDAMKNDRGCKAKTNTLSLAARARAACQKVQLGEVSRARQCLVGASVAPGTNDTFRAMQGRRPHEVVREINEEVRQFEPGVPVVLDRATFSGWMDLRASEDHARRHRHP